MKKNVIRRGSWVTMLRTYAIDPDDKNSPKIERGMRVRVTNVKASAFGGKMYTVTDGEHTIGPLPAHVVQP